MADIELVIRIPEDKYNQIINFYQESKVRPKDYEIAIINGTPLPKGHGRLKDVDAIMRELSVVSSRPVKSQMYMIEQAQTLIKADKAESEEEDE